jgi:hypothetical protein
MKRFPPSLPLLLLAVACSDTTSPATDPDAAPLGPTFDAGSSVLPDVGADALVTDMVPVVVAQGKLGRIAVSCDDGRTFPIDRADDVGAARCWSGMPDAIECDHHKASSLGLLQANGYLFATLGWGYPGVVKRSRDAIVWEDVFPGHTFAGLVAVNGSVVGNDRSPWLSAQSGDPGTWRQGGDVGSAVWNVRRAVTVPASAGTIERLVVSMNSGDASDIVLSDDTGATFRKAKSFPIECAKNVINIVAQSDVVIMFQTNGGVCRSLDRGDTWTYASIAAELTSPALYADGMFRVWSGATQHRSARGDSWQSQEGSPKTLRVGPVTRTLSGAYVAVNETWQKWYEKQEVYRSEDGVTWSPLAPGAIAPSHPLTHLWAGAVKRSTACK